MIHPPGHARAAGRAGVPRGRRGAPYAAFGPEWTDAWDAVGRASTTPCSWTATCCSGRAERPADRGLADVACGTGHALIVLARRVPRGHVHRLRPRRARDRPGPGRGGGRWAGERELRGSRRGPAHGEVDFDVVFVFDAIHDQAEPDAVRLGLPRSGARRAPVHARTHGADTLAENLGNPMAPVLYSVSTLHCMTVSLAHGGAGSARSSASSGPGACSRGRLRGA